MTTAEIMAELNKIPNATPSLKAVVLSLPDHIQPELIRRLIKKYSYKEEPQEQISEDKGGQLYFSFTEFAPTAMGKERK